MCLFLYVEIFITKICRSQNHSRKCTTDKKCRRHLTKKNENRIQNKLFVISGNRYIRSLYLGSLLYPIPCQLSIRGLTYSPNLHFLAKFTHFFCINKIFRELKLSSAVANELLWYKSNITFKSMCITDGIFCL